MEAIGVDLGGTKMLVGVMDYERRMLYRSTAPSLGLSQEELGILSALLTVHRKF